MFKQSCYPVDGIANGVQPIGASVPQPPPPPPAPFSAQPFNGQQFVGQPFNGQQFVGQQQFNAHQFVGQQQFNGHQFVGQQQFNGHQFVGQQQFPGQVSHSPFIPDLHQFPYTFSSSSPPMYSWANTNSTDIMKFTGSSNPQPLDTSTYHLSNFGSIPKRKIDLDDEFPQPPKMRITEEKVSASLRDMHISSKFKPHSYCLENDVSKMDMVDNQNLTNTIETVSSESQATLVMCEELRKLNKIDSIIPQPLLNLDRPKNAVVIWKPQPVLDLVRSFSNDEPKSTVVITEITDEEEEAINNQNRDQNVMHVEDYNCIAAEDDEMEL